MKIQILLLCSFFQTFFLNAQSLSPIDEQFENFEYSNALAGYESLKGTVYFDSDHDEKLAYCYYVLGETKGLKHLDSLTLSNANKDYLWLWKGTLEKDNGAYEEAIKSFENFKHLNKELSVDNFIASCKEIPTWSNIPNSSVLLSSSNDKNANGFSVIPKNEILFFETGIDANNNFLGIASKSNEYAEVLLSKPFLFDGQSLVEIKIEGLEYSSIHRICSDNVSNEIIFDAVDLNVEKPISRLYKGVFVDGKITNVQLLNISKSDTVSFAHPTLNSAGNKMILAAVSASTKNSDLYIATLENGDWTNLTALSALNSPGNESYPTLIGDSILCFSSDGRIGYGGLDIYHVGMNQLNNPASVRHYKFPLNSPMDDFNVNWTNKLQAKFVSNRKSGIGDDDVWNLVIEGEKIPEVIDDGFENWFKKWQVSKVYFDFNSAVTELNQDLLDGLKRYAGKYNLVLDLVGHTDARGIPEYNQQLGLNRARYVADKISEHALSKEVISIRSVGEKELVNSCRNGVKCTDQQHLENRFVSIQLMKH